MGGRPEHLAHLKPGRGGSELVVFGRRAVLEALACSAVEILEVCLAREQAPAYRKQLAAACRERGVALTPSSSGAVSEMSREPRHDQGVAARIRLLALMESEGFIGSLKGAKARRPVRVLALDGVTNSQNIGMIVRSALASGMDALLWPLVGSPWVNGLVVKASAATVLRCPIVRCESLVQGLADLTAVGFRCVGLCARAECSVFDHHPPHRAVYVIGSETEGIGPDVMGMLDQQVCIPMQSGVESLNVAVASSLLCFQLGREPAA